MIQYNIFPGGKKKIVTFSYDDGSATNKPRLRVFDVEGKRQITEVDLTAYGLTEEPEMVEIYQGQLYYGDAHGNFFKVRSQV